MKKVILSLVMVASLSFVSCKEETTTEDAPVVEETEIPVEAPVETVTDSVAPAVDPAAPAADAAPAAPAAPAK
jgi:hypothetical protein